MSEHGFIDFTDVHTVRIPYVRYRYEVTGDTLVRLGSEAITRAEALFAGAAYRIDAMDVEPLLTLRSGEVTMWRAEVVAVTA